MFSCVNVKFILRMIFKESDTLLIGKMENGSVQNLISMCCFVYYSQTPRHYVVTEPASNVTSYSYTSSRSSESRSDNGGIPRTSYSSKTERESRGSGPGGYSYSSVSSSTSPNSYSYSSVSSGRLPHGTSYRHYSYRI